MASKCIRVKYIGDPGQVSKCPDTMSHCLLRTNGCPGFVNGRCCLNVTRVVYEHELFVLLSDMSGYIPIAELVR